MQHYLCIKKGKNLLFVEWLGVRTRPSRKEVLHMSTDDKQRPASKPQQTPPPQHRVPTTDAPGRKHYSETNPQIERRSVSINTDVVIPKPKDS